MKLVKDSPLSIGWRTWEFSRGERRVIVTVKATVELPREGVGSLAPEQELVTGDLFWDDDVERTVRYASDLAVVKPEGEMWLTGTLRTAEPVRELACRARVGEVETRFSVLGDRRWRADGGMTEPEAFTTMELCWERSFGGPGFTPNPVGRGIAADESGVVALPNIEQHGRLIRSPRARPDPAGAWPVPRTWPERASLMGTYGANYARERWPYLADDFVWRYFQASREPLRVRGYWRGDEEVELYHLHPEHPRVSCRLPGLKPRVFLRAAPRGQEPEPLSEVGMVLDTVAIDVGEGRALLVWRGTAPCATELLGEFEHIYLTHEPLDAPRTPQAYWTSFAAALRAQEEEERAFEAEPPPPPPAESSPSPAPAESAPEEPTPQALRDEQRRDALAQGLPPDVVDTLYPAEFTAPELPSRAQQRAQIEEAIESAKSLNSPGVVEGLEEMLRAHDEQGAPPEEETEAKRSPEPPPGLWTAQELRDLVRRRMGLGESLSGLNLAGADLGLLDLSGQDLSGALLQGADLRASNLDGANLDGASLDRALLDAASLRGATLRGASLASVEASGACFAGATLEDATFEQATLMGTDFTRAQGHRVSIEECIAVGAIFEEAQLDESELARSNFDEASFRRASMMDARVEGSSMRNACFDQVDAQGLRASDGADLSEAKVRWAKLSKATFSESTLIGTKFTESDLTRATFAGAQMEGSELLAVKARGASFASARLAGASLAGADLLGARFEAADLRIADLSGANLYQAEFWRADTTGARLVGANVEGSKLE